MQNTFMILNESKNILYSKNDIFNLPYSMEII